MIQHFFWYSWCDGGVSDHLGRRDAVQALIHDYKLSAYHSYLRSLLMEQLTMW